MAQTERFTHITVTPDTEDEIVIEAGAVRARDAAQSNSSIVEAPRDDASEQSAAADGASRAVEDVPAEPEGAGAEQGAPTDEDEGYREQTLDDLASSPMSLTQRIVLVAVVVFIVAFIVYYLFFRG